ncbi:MAG TPA: alpha-ketoacid dehydrogenase subunit beta [Phycisphaerales bacterium]|nr:alpha-ketoacid dehydrogenase subunit beta [Phycisphaerales bacterium]HIB49982.1 alpha-ketoacid dehydrogenase subunit beta [Phycisphaerales bacterium]HIN84682.1 alpha-ketoacid dehydrogenase subunit beta [Phycisphaerales bacterium]HIO20537.1 alpha-ketoacid dehydrogenase subunit beta [Phycisphaerales bacterium]HIO53131.1 alpha-ketoacid dehydrogenase subunit beta [Phycisphaerales bacterium]
MSKLTMVEAINLALSEEMERDENVCMLGEDIGVNGGVFRATKDLQKKYGEERVMDTPLAECGIVGTAIGMAVYGVRPVVEIQFSGFTMQAFDQIEQNMARLRNRTRGKYNIPIVLRTPFGGGIRAVEHHSESREAYWAHTPGLKVVIPSGPRNARALLAAAIREDDPIIFYEPKAVYRAFREDVPDKPEIMEIGKAEVVRTGKDITLISYGAMMRPCKEAVNDLADDHGIDVELIDLLTISPMDTETLAASVQKTGRCIIVHEGQRTCGVAAEIIARLNEVVFEFLEAPIKRITGFDIPFPYFQVEEHFLPESEEIILAIKDTIDWQ